MTNFNEFDALVRDVRIAEEHGFTFSDDGISQVNIRACNTCFPGLVDNVVIHRAPDLKSALQFIDGVLWHQMYVRNVK